MITVTAANNQKVIENIKLIAVGNAGISMLDRIFLETGGGIDCAAINTDSTSLNASMATEKILIGEQSIRGLGAGGDPELGRQAVEESHDKLVELVTESGAAIFLGGLGGGTGGEVLVELQKLAREMNRPSFHIVTLPFGFEGPRRMRQANETLHLLRQRGALVAAFPNERLGETTSSSGPIGEAFAACDHTLDLAARALLEVLNGTGPWETSATELFGLLAHSNPDGATFFSTAVGKGGTRAHDVVPKLLKSPLAKAGLPLAEVRTLHIHLSSGAGLSLAEIRTTVDLLRRELEDETLIHIGVSTDRREAQELAVTLFGSARTPQQISARKQAPVIEQKKVEIPESRAPQQTVAQAGAIPDDLPAAPVFFEPGPDQSAVSSDENRDGIEPVSAEPLEPESDQISHSIQSTPEPVAQETCPDDMLPGMESIHSNPRPPVRPVKKSGPKPKQEVLPLDVASRGRFERSEPTIEEGEDLDVPAFIRLKIRLK